MEEKHPGIKYTLFRSIERIRKAASDNSEKIHLRRCKICGEPTTDVICQVCKILNELRC